MTPEFLSQMAGTAFALLQALVVGAVSASFKMYFDVRKNTSDLDHAFKKIRDLEEKINNFQ